MEGEPISDWGVKGKTSLGDFSCSSVSLTSSFGSSSWSSDFRPGTNEWDRDTPMFTTEDLMAAAKSSSALKEKSNLKLQQ